MKDTISFYYNIDIDTLEEKDGKYHFKYQNRDFFFVFFNRNLEELEDLLDCISEIQKKGIDIHGILINKDNSILTKISEYNYILFSVNNCSETYDTFDIIDMNNKLTLNNYNSKLYRNNWENLWMQKVDYFEYQIRELGLDKQVIKNSFSYYIGLAENAISYVHNVKLKYPSQGTIVLSHRRIFYPNYKLNYLNPLSFIFDLEVRDIAEYLKAMFFSDDDESEVLEELKSFLKIKRLTIYEYNMFYARLLYPSYYFDIYEEVMNKERSEEDLLKIISKNKNFEEFLKKAYLEITKYAILEKVEWIIN